MVIGILSDTHDRSDGIRRAMAAFKRCKVGYILHAGDWTTPATLELCAKLAGDIGVSIAGVLGNNDVAGELNTAAAESIHLDLTLQLTLGGKRIGVCHGHRPTDLGMFIETGCDVIFRGHSHKAKVETIEETLVINPGSTAFSIPRSKQDLRSVAVFDTGSLSAEIIPLASSI
jgi:putative phosphoesterase